MYFLSENCLIINQTLILFLSQFCYPLHNLCKSKRLLIGYMLDKQLYIVDFEAFSSLSVFSDVF